MTAGKNGPEYLRLARFDCEYDGRVLANAVRALLDQEPSVDSRREALSLLEEIVALRSNLEMLGECLQRWFLASLEGGADMTKD